MSTAYACSRSPLASTSAELGSASTSHTLIYQFCHRTFIAELETWRYCVYIPAERRRDSMVTGPRVGYVIALTLVVCSTGCATMEGAPTPRDVDEAIRARTAAPGIRLDSQNTLPPDVN